MIVNGVECPVVLIWRLPPCWLQTATALGLAARILIFGPASGAHFNPLVSLADWLLGRRRRTGISGTTLLTYAVAQVVGGIAGTVLANVMFDRRVIELATKGPVTPGHLVGEVVATAVLRFGIHPRSNRAGCTFSGCGRCCIGAAYWFTSSTSFANPAVTLGQIFSDTFAGISPASVPPFIAAQVAGGLVGAALVVALYPDVRQAAGEVVVPHNLSQTSANE